jgi:hypothetical protein
MGASYIIITSTLEPEMASDSPSRSTDNGASHVEVRQAGQWRNSSTLADESESECGAVGWSPFISCNTAVNRLTVWLSTEPAGLRMATATAALVVYGMWKICTAP